MWKKKDLSVRRVLRVATVSGRRVLRLNSRTLRVVRQVLQDMTNMSGSK